MSHNMIANSIWAETKAPKFFYRTFEWVGNAPMGMRTEHGINKSLPLLNQNMIDRNQLYT
jgi:hypothetical protein